MRRDNPHIVERYWDLAAHELTRLVEVRRALGPDFDEIAALREEQLAEQLLYSGLDEEQQATHDMLVRAGVLAPREERRDVA